MTWDEIYEALLELRKPGTTLQAVRSQPALTGLRYVARAATNDGQPQPTLDHLAAVVRHEISDAAGELGIECLCRGAALQQ